MLQSHLYNSLLQPGEKVLLVTDRHWIKRLPAHYIMCVGIILFAVGLYLRLGGHESWNSLVTLLLGVWVFGVIALYFLSWSFMLSRRGLVLTNFRLLHFSQHALSRSNFIIPYRGIEESDINESFFSHWFGYGDWDVIVHENKDVISFKGYAHIKEIEQIINHYMATRPIVI